MFSTITSPVFSELTIVFAGYGMSHLPRDADLFATLRRMNEIRPFKLVLLLEVSGPPQEGALRKLTESLDSVTAAGLLYFLGSPPIIRCARFRQQGWELDTSSTNLY